MTQSEALNILKSGVNVYLTGSAGSGKTYVLNQYIEYLKAHGVEIAVTASTGIAATHMNGMTIHSWSGLGVRNTLSDYDIDSLEEKQYLWKRFDKTKVLIIDEVSMLHANQLDMIDRLARAFKRNEMPFGGMQVILSGDFFQLPPVTKGNEKVCFVNESEAWACMDIKICYLEEQHRQNDGVFTKILNEIRDNNVSEETMEHFRSRYKKKPIGEIMPTKLFTHNTDVDAINELELGKIEGDVETYEMSSKGKDSIVETLKKSCLSPEVLRLKIGASVMFVKNNFEKGYVNGTLGKVVDFTELGPLVKLKDGREVVACAEDWMIEEDGKIKAQISQIPLRLAWAVTVHKSQGMSLDAAEMDLSKSFVAGQGYVALSRLRTLEGLCLHGLNKTALEVDKNVLKLDRVLRDLSENMRLVFDDISIGEKEVMHKDFIIKSGGTFDKKTIEKNIKADKKSRVRGSTYDETKKLLTERMSVKEIAKERGMTEGTILSHLEKILETDSKFPIEHLKPEASDFRAIKKAFKESGDTKLSPVYEILNGKYSYEDLRVARLFLD